MTTDDLKMRIPRICSNAVLRGAAPFRRRPGRDSALRIGPGHRRPLTFRRRGVSRSAGGGMYNTAAADFTAVRGQERETLRELRRIASLLNGLKPVLREDLRLELE